MLLSRPPLIDTHCFVAGYNYSNYLQFLFGGMIVRRFERTGRTFLKGIAMATKLPKFTLDHDKVKDDWRLTNDATNRVVKRFGTKGEAIKGGVLENALGTGGGSVKIKKIDDQYQEERTYPRTSDPKKSPG